MTLTMVVAIATLFVPQASAAFKYLHPGMKAPEVSGEDIVSGQEVSSKQALDDGLALIVFWASWSERSIEQLKDMKEFAERYVDQPLSIFAVNVEGETISKAMREQLKKLVLEMELPFPIIIDEELKTFYEFGVIAVPSTALLDKEGVLRFDPAGYSFTSHDRIEDSIEVLLGLREASIDTMIVDGYHPSNTASRYYELARNLNRRGMFERALGNVSRAINEDSLFAAPYCLRGEALLSLKEPDSAVSAFRVALTLDSTSIVAWTGLGEAHLHSQSLDSALPALEQALTLDSAYTPALLFYALCLSQKNDIEGALEFLRRASELNAKDPTVLYYLGRVKTTAGDSAGAVEAFLQALETLFPQR